MAHLLAKVIEGNRELPAGRRGPFGWPMVGIERAAVVLRFEDDATAGGGRLRITVGLSLRTCVKVGAFAAQSQLPLGEFDIRYAPSVQTFEIPLDAAAMKVAAAEGVELRLTEGEEVVWIFSAGAPEVLLPHLLVGDGGDRLEVFLERMESMACVQAFGWMEGCVLDGLLDLHQKFPQRRFLEVARQHLELFLTQAGHLIFENANSEPEENRLKTIEETLMFAAAVRLLPRHPSIAIAREFWESRHRQFGLVTDPGMPSAEGCYTAAYPLMVAARELDIPQYAEWALSELRVRRDRLVLDGNVWLRSYDDGRRTFKNWSRGVAWYFLGMVKTLTALGERAKADDVQDLRDEIRRVADFVLARRTPEGIWNCFVGEDETPPDSAGSAGIAAALAFGAHHGLLNESAKIAAGRAADTLLTRLTPDGLLTGVSQTNRGGEALQRGDYRVIFPMGMGLLAQAIAWR